MQEQTEWRRTPMNGDDLRRWSPILSPQQEAAVDLMAAGASVTETAKKLGVARQTTSEWRNHHPTFQATLNERRKELWSSVTDRLRSLLPPALDLLEKEIRQGNVNVALALVRAGFVATQKAEQPGLTYNDNRAVSIGKDYSSLMELTPLQRDQLRRRIQGQLLEIKNLKDDDGAKTNAR
jgi:transposase-like protein